MKICILGNNGSIHIQKWVQALSNRESLEVHVISFDQGTKFENVIYHYLKPYFKNKADYLLNVPLLNKIIKIIKPDILHSHYATSYGFMGALINYHPLIITGWGADIFDSPKYFLMKSILRYSLKKADSITVLTKVTLKEISKCTEKKVELVPFGVDINKFTNQSGLEKSSIDFRIGTIRTLSPKYGIEYLIRAFAILYPKYSNIKLEIVGDGEQRAFLENLSLELNISDRVTFHGFISQTIEFEKYIRILNSFNVFAIPSVMESETFGVAAVEAAACGIPVIATNIGGLPEVVDDNITGLLVPIRDSKQTALAIEKIILDSKFGLTMGLNAQKKVKNYFSWDDNVSKMISIYKETINK